LITTLDKCPQLTHGLPQEFFELEKVDDVLCSWKTHTHTHTHNSDTHRVERGWEALRVPGEAKSLMAHMIIKEYNKHN
jgi:hypothetical protein